MVLSSVLSGMIHDFVVGRNDGVTEWRSWLQPVRLAAPNKGREGKGGIKGPLQTPTNTNRDAMT